MNTNLEPGFMIEDFCEETGRVSVRGNPVFDDVTDLAPFLAWVVADCQRATIWHDLRGINECNDLELVMSAIADDKLGWAPCHAISTG
jgi:hypothetical protein